MMDQAPRASDASCKKLAAFCSGFSARRYQILDRATSMDDVALANYIAGFHFGSVEAGRLDKLCAQLLGVEVCTEIWFSDYTLLKLRQRHGDINFSHYRHMPSILLHGFLARGRKSNLLDFWWIGLVRSEVVAFFVVLKATRKGEVFVETFHRIDVKEARRLLKRAKLEGRLVREQTGVQAYLKSGTDHLRPSRNGRKLKKKRA
jgi:hypothetical protein